MGEKGVTKRAAGQEGRRGASEVIRAPDISLTVGA
jgi:hypothetical protein